MSSRWRIGRKVLLVGLALLVAVGLFVAFRVGQALWYLSDRRPFPVNVSRETTYLTEPLREDGSVDYLAAINAKLGEGVTPENNAAVVLWQALGSAQMNRTWSDRYFSELGIAPPSANNEIALPYFVYPGQPLVPPAAGGDSLEVNNSTSDAVADRLRIFDELSVAVHRPWTAAEFPLVAAWLDHNEPILELVVAASERPRYWDPLVATPGQIASLVWSDGGLRTDVHYLAEALAARATRRVAEKHIAQAQRDALALRKLSQLVQSGPQITDRMRAIDLFEQACVVERAIASSGQLDGTELAAMQGRLARTAIPEGFADCVDYCQRLTCLDAIACAALAAAGNLPIEEKEPGKFEFPQEARALGIDWDFVLARANRAFDRQAAALRLPTRAERRAAIQMATDDLEAETAEVNGTRAKVWIWLGSRSMLSRHVAAEMLQAFVPPAWATEELIMKSEMHLGLTRLSVALAAYIAANGRYPERLEELAPKFINPVPLDVFSNQPLAYHSTASGYDVRSLGRNGTLDEADEDVGGMVVHSTLNDDLVIRAGEPVKMELPGREPPIPQ